MIRRTTWDRLERLRRRSKETKHIKAFARGSSRYIRKDKKNKLVILAAAFVQKLQTF